MIYLVDSSPSLLSAMSERAQQYAYDNLMKMGVEVHLNKHIKDYLDDTVIFTDGETIQSKILFWTTGVTGSMVEYVPPLHEGKNLAVNFLATLQGQTINGVRLQDKGSMAIIGRHKAVADLPKPEVHMRSGLRGNYGCCTPFFIDQLPQQGKGHVQVGSGLFYKGSVIENDNKTRC